MVWDIAPDSKFVAYVQERLRRSQYKPAVEMLSLEHGYRDMLEDFQASAVAISPAAKRLALLGASGQPYSLDVALYVWEIEADELKLLHKPGLLPLDPGVLHLGWIDEDTVCTRMDEGDPPNLKTSIVRFDVNVPGSYEVLAQWSPFAVSPDGRYLAHSPAGKLVIRDLETGAQRVLDDYYLSGEGLSWSGDGKFLCFVDIRRFPWAFSTNEPWEVVVMRVSDGKRYPVKSWGPRQPAQFRFIDRDALKELIPIPLDFE